MIGNDLLHYHIETQLGAGGMGEVYQARDTKLGRGVAVKILPEIFARDLERVARFEREAKLLAALNHSNIAAFVVDPDRRARFEREARVLASLNHPHIATIYGFEEEAGVHALALELVEGETLDERIAHGKIPLEDTLQIAR